MSGISKLLIKAYSDDAFTALKGEFSASINPENLKITSSVEYAMAQGMGSAGMGLQYNISPPRVLTFKLFFDNTGIIPNSEANVQEQLENLTNLIYNFQNEINAPYGIRVIWGVIDFKGKLVNFETSYTLFQSNGTPIRAEAYIVVYETVTPTTSTSQAAASAATTTTAQDTAAASNHAAADTNNTASNINNAPENEADAATASEAATSSEAEAAENDTVAGAAAGAGTGAALGAATGAAAGAATGDAVGAATGDAVGAATGDAANEAPTAENTALQQVQEGDTVPSIANDSLGDPNFAKDLGSLNGLDSLRDLAAGLALAVPLSLAALLAGLLALALKYTKEAGSFLESKGEKAKNYAEEKV